MIKKKISCIAAAAVISTSVPFASSASDSHTVMILDFDGSVMETLTVPHGETLDLSGIDTESLNRHPDIYTQIAFSSWGNLPESGKVTEDIVINALFRRMTISCNAYPEKTEYYSNEGKINLRGLDITITDYLQLPEKEKNGSYIVREEVTNIESKCSTVPADLGEAFSGGKNSATVDVYPINSDIPIISYEITYFPTLGDVNFNTFVDSSDASSVLYEYAAVSIGNKSILSDKQKRSADVDRNGTIDSTDASVILSYYSVMSTSPKKVTWDEFFDGLED